MDEGLMTTAKEHYEQLLATRYSWMTGLFSDQVGLTESLLTKFNLCGKGSEKALDLGCGHGIQSIALAKNGYTVTAVDTNEHLLDELKQSAGELPIEVQKLTITDAQIYRPQAYQVITCCGDTLPHLESFDELYHVVANAYTALVNGGKLYLSFRDYSEALQDTNRFIPVRSDANRILTCFLEYSPEFVRVTDIFHEKVEGEWKQFANSYRKLRLTLPYMMELLEGVGFSVVLSETINRMQHVVAQK